MRESWIESSGMRHLAFLLSYIHEFLAQKIPNDTDPFIDADPFIAARFPMPERNRDE
jgi:hypothetical protein